MNQDILKKFASDTCGKCGGPAPGWKCPKCATVSPVFDPLHLKKCRFGAKMQAECEKCREAEENCTCAHV